VPTKKKKKKKKEWAKARIGNSPKAETTLKNKHIKKILSFIREVPMKISSENTKGDTIFGQQCNSIL
jgi:hypothetical protein